MSQSRSMKILTQILTPEIATIAKADEESDKDSDDELIFCLTPTAEYNQLTICRVYSVAQLGPKPTSKQT
jgi:hypothetical protein